MKNIIKELLTDLELYHSEFQIDNFIIGNQGNTWAQYKQCLREISGRWRSVQAAGQKKIIMQLELKQLKRKRFFLSKLKREIHKQKIESMQIAIEDTEVSKRHTTRELNRFVKLAQELKDKIGDLSNGRREKLEREMWIEKTKRMIKIDMICHGALSKSTYEMIISLPNDTADELLKPLKKQTMINEV